MGVLYVDDTNIYIMYECIRSEYDLWQETHGAITSWGKLLLATGGALKPEKCFYYIIDYEWQDDGSWEYSKLVNTLHPITVPLSDGTEATIYHLPVDEARKTLGIWTNPAGMCDKQLDAITSALQTWLDRLTVGQLPTKWA